MTINNWKLGTEDIVRHEVLKDYIQDTVAKHDIDSVTVYNTRVEQVSQDGDRWRVQANTLGVSKSGTFSKVAKTWVS